MQRTVEGPRRVRSQLRPRLRRVLVGLLVLALAPLACDVWISLSTRVHRDVHAVPSNAVALVLGTARLHDGRPNRFYTARLEAARDLYQAGAVRGILVSGDNGRPDYDEPGAMREDLVRLGVPAEHVTCDYAGFRTLDSVVRAKRVFGLDRVTVVSQPFHAERAVFLARRNGLDAIAFGAQDPALGSWLEIRAREVAARCLAVWDAAVGRGPRFLGPPVRVGLRE